MALRDGRYGAPGCFFQILLLHPSSTYWIFFFVQATAENTRSDAVDDRKRWKRGSRGMAIDSRHFHLQIIIFFSCIISRAEM